MCGSGFRVQGSCRHTEHVAMYEPHLNPGGPNVCGSGSRVQGSCKHTEQLVAMYEPHLNPGGPNVCGSGSRVQGRCKHTEHVAMYDPQVNPTVKSLSTKVESLHRKPGMREIESSKRLNIQEYSHLIHLP